MHVNSAANVKRRVWASCTAYRYDASSDGCGALCVSRAGQLLSAYQDARLPAC